MFVPLACVAFLAADPAADGPQKALDALQGEWVVEQFTTAESDDAGEDLKGQSMTFTGKTWSFAGIIDGKTDGVDPTSDPAAVDLTATPKDGDPIPIEGVYKLTGDTLVLSVHIGADRNRPTGFDKPTVTGTVLLTLKRAEK